MKSTFRHIMPLLALGAVTFSVVPAVGQGVEAGRDIIIKNRSGDQNTVGIGQDVQATSTAGSVRGNVRAGRDIKIDSRSGDQNTVGIGQRVCAASTAGSVTSETCKD